ncbi:MAG: hypothetical protein NTW87_00540 [Planctomycetota bacterium]|nr:hypothetical protein [Planctomycetota bacterium]
MVRPAWIRVTLGTLLWALVAGGGGAGEGLSTAPAFVSPLTVEDLDPAAFAQWVEGAEKPFELKDGPRHVIWTRNSRPEWDGVRFSDSKKTGVRHMRIGWKTPIAVGTVLARGGGQVSVLKADATYPGDMKDESHWVLAQRLKNGKVSRDEGGGEDIVVWVLPPKTSTRAIRFSHSPEPTDKIYAGWLGGVCVLGERFGNVGSQASVITTHKPDKAALIADDSNNGTWGIWDNAGNESPISPDHPEVVTLVFSAPVTLRGLCALFAGFGAAQVFAYAGPDDRHPSAAAAADWQCVAAPDKVENGYPVQLWPNWIDFGKQVTTRAIQLRMTKVCAEGHPHMKGNTKGGKRVWIAELLALMPLGEADLATAVLPVPAAADLGHPPIPVKFTLKEPALVTLVIDDTSGKRVRNLVSEAPFPAGENTAWWDGTDDLGRDPQAYAHGLYSIPAQFVKPGDYTVRGLVRKQLDLRFEFSIYNAGSPAWETEDGTGCWTTNHTPPRCVQYVPAEKAPGGKPLVFIGSYVSEGGHGLAWVDLDGKKQGGRGTVGGAWTGAQHLARDVGPNADPKTFAYVGSGWEMELRLFALTREGDKQVVKYSVKKKEESALAGIAVHNGTLVCSLPVLKQLLFIDAKARKVLGAADLAETGGVAFDSDGRLLVLVGKQLQRYKLPETLGEKVVLPAPQIVVDRLEEPQQIAFDKQGNLYVSDRGGSHQVKVFTADGKPLRAIGVAGVPKAGPYDARHLNSPAGLTIDSNDHLWVAEEDYQPKRVSVWTLDGTLVKAFYGPSMYGGGGTLDYQDKSRFYFNGMEFKLDWEKGTDQLQRVFFRSGPNDQFPPDGFGCNGMPEMPHYVNGKRYFSNWHNSNPTNGANVVCIWLDRDGIAVPAAAVGMAKAWKVLADGAFKGAWPAGMDPKGDQWKNQALFSWSDKNGDGRAQPEEVTMVKAGTGGITVMPDLAVIVSRVNDKTVRYAPKFDKDVPSYDLAAGETLASGVQGPCSSGGDQALSTADGWTVLSLGVKPYSPYSLSGTCKGEPKWSYPNPWPGLHASHEAPVPDFPGQVIGTTRLLGGFITPQNSDAGPLWAINGNMGPMYLFTADGLFVATLFKDVRVGRSWRMPVAERGMLLNDVAPHDENFWPTIAQTPDGKVYVVDGARTSLVRVDNLESIKRFPDSALKLTEEQLAKAREWQIEREAVRQKALGSGTLKVAIRKEAPVLDGKLDDWKDADWATIDRRGTAANFNSNSKPYDVAAAACVSGDKLCVAWRTNEKDLLRNSGEMPTAPFKTGGCLDVMIGTDPKASEKRGEPAPGDVRLLVTRVKNKTLALLYRAKVPGAKDPVPFSSPWRTITIDKVDNVSEQVEFGSNEGNYEIAIPLATLGLRPAAGMAIKADVGVLRGDGMQTTQRVYWSNKGTAITSDVPSEAMLTPSLWGKWVFE